MAFSFVCKSCSEVHHGIPTFGADAPELYYRIPESERAQRAFLTTDACVLDHERYFARGCIEIPVEGEADPFIWGVWLDISKADFHAFQDTLGVEKRNHVGPFAGYLATVLPVYEDTFNLHAVMTLRDDGIRPLVTISQSRHALHREQCTGISQARMSEIYEEVMHG